MSGSPRVAPPTDGAEFVTYNGRTLPTKPLVSAMPMLTARRRYKLASETIWKWIDNGTVRAVVNKAGRVQVSGFDITRAIKARETKRTGGATAPPPDGQPISQLARDLGLDDGTINYWCQLPRHPTLGREVRKGIGTAIVTTSHGRNRQMRLMLVSRADIAAIVEVGRNPYLRPIAENPGEWLSDGIFQHNDRRVFFTAAYVYDHQSKYGIRCGGLGTFDRHKSKQLESMRVVWPVIGPRDKPTRIVYSAESLDRLVERRAGKADGGEWLTPGGIWADCEGCWYSSRFIADRLQVDLSRIHSDLRASGILTKFKKVPLGGKKADQTVVVHHESEVRPLLGIASPTSVSNATQPAAVAGPRKKAGRPKGARSSGRVKQEREMLALWDRGTYCDNMALAGRTHGFKDRSTARKIILAHEEKKRREQKPSPK